MCLAIDNITHAPEHPVLNKAVLTPDVVLLGAQSPTNNGLTADSNHGQDARNTYFQAHRMRQRPEGQVLNLLYMWQQYPGYPRPLLAVQSWLLSALRA